MQHIKCKYTCNLNNSLCLVNYYSHCFFSYSMILKTVLSVSQSSLGIQINMKTFTLGAENFASRNFREFREFWAFSWKFRTQKVLFWPIRENLYSRNFSRFSLFFNLFFIFSWPAFSNKIQPGSCVDLQYPKWIIYCASLVLLN